MHTLAVRNEPFHRRVSRGLRGVYDIKYLATPDRLAEFESMDKQDIKCAYDKHTKSHTNMYNWSHFALASWNSDSDIAFDLPIAGLHLIVNKFTGEKH